MRYQLNPPQHIAQQGRWLSPAAGTATGDDRLFIASDSSQLAQALIAAINERLSTRRRITPADFDALLDEAMPAAGERLKTCCLALALMMPCGCLVAQMGKSRVLHIDTHGEVQYDSRNQLLDYGSKARTGLITRFEAGDCLVLTLTDRVDPLALAATAAGTASDGEQRAAAVVSQLSEHREQAPASYVITLAGSSGRLLNIADVNWRWVTLYAALAGAIALLAWASLTGRLQMPDFAPSAQSPVPAAQSPQPDTAAAPLLPPAAVAVPDEPAAPATPAEQTRAAKAEKPSTAEQHDAPTAAPNTESETPQPSAQSPQPEVHSPKPEAQSPEHKAPNPEPATPSPEPKAQSL